LTSSALSARRSRSSISGRIRAIAAGSPRSTIELELSTGVTDTIPCPGWPPGGASTVWSTPAISRAEEFSSVTTSNPDRSTSIRPMRARIRARLSAKSATTTLLAPGLARTCPCAPTSGRIVSAAEAASIFRNWNTSVENRSEPTVAGPWAAPCAGLIR